MTRAPRIVVLKFGSSILKDDRGLWPAVHEVYREVRRGRSVVAVVSAPGRTTDELLARARSIAPDPAPDSLAPLLATGERTAAALFALALEAAGVPAVALDPADIGLRLVGSRLEADPLTVDVGILRSQLRRCAVAVVPGFFGQYEGGGVALLGRGGSDCTALFVAQRLGVPCRLLKDVDGVYERDPAAGASRRYRTLRFDDAVRLGAKVVQAKALALARGSAHPFCISSPGAGAGTRVGTDSTELAPPRTPPAPLRVVLLGLGTVGSGVYRHLVAMPAHFVVTGVAVRHPERYAARGVPAHLLHSDAPAAAAAPADVVVELMGGLEPAARVVRDALDARRHVVTANKAVIAEHGPQLERLAAARGVRLLYSASVAGAVPALERVRRIARVRRIDRIDAVLNGTTNFVLDRISAGATLEAATAEARERGFAEADPTLDLDGTDAAQKLAIVARAAFGVVMPWSSIERRGIERVSVARALEAAASGRVLRLVASAWREAATLRATVAPRALPGSHPLSRTRNEGSAVVARCVGRRPIVIAGKGAGQQPTAVAVIADLMDLRRSRLTSRAGVQDHDG